MINKHKLTKIISLTFYYLIARWLPASYWPTGPIFKAIRLMCVKSLFYSVGKGVNVEHGAFFGKGNGISIGDNSGIGVNAALHGHIKIGNNVMMGPDVMIFAMNHDTRPSRLPMISNGFSDDCQIVIEDDVWIGARAIILSGVRVGHGSVIGAGAVLAKSVEPWSVVVGNPGRVVKSRSPE